MSLRRKLIYMLLGVLKVEHDVKLSELSPEAEKVFAGDDGNGFVAVTVDEQIGMLLRAVDLMVRSYQVPLETHAVVWRLKAHLRIIRENVEREKDEAIKLYTDTKAVLGGQDV